MNVPYATSADVSRNPHRKFRMQNSRAYVQDWAMFHVVLILWYDTRCHLRFLISLYHNMFVPSFKGCITVKCWTFQTVVAVLWFAFTHLVIASLMTSYYKLHLILISYTKRTATFFLQIFTCSCNFTTKTATTVNVTIWIAIF